MEGNSKSAKAKSKKKAGGWGTGFFNDGKKGKGVGGADRSDNDSSNSGGGSSNNMSISSSDASAHPSPSPHPTTTTTNTNTKTTTITTAEAPPPSTQSPKSPPTLSHSLQNVKQILSRSIVNAYGLLDGTLTSSSPPLSSSSGPRAGDARAEARELLLGVLNVLDSRSVCPPLSSSSSSSSSPTSSDGYIYAGTHPLEELYKPCLFGLSNCYYPENCPEGIKCLRRVVANQKYDRQAKKRLAVCLCQNGHREDVREGWDY